MASSPLLFGFILIGFIVATILGIVVITYICRDHRKNHPTPSTTLARDVEPLRTSVSSSRAPNVVKRLSRTFAEMARFSWPAVQLDPEIEDPDSFMVYVSPSSPRIFGPGEGVHVVRYTVTPPTPAKDTRRASLIEYEDSEDAAHDDAYDLDEDDSRPF